MAKTIMIFIDTLGVTWGDGSHLNHNDATFRGNFKVDNPVGSDGYIENSAGDDLKYSNAIFTTPKPVKLVIRSGDVNGIDLATAYTNAGQSLFPHSTRATITAGGTIVSNTRNSSTFMFGVLNDIARKADGSPATTDGEAVYFEIVWQVGRLLYTYDFVGIEALALDVSTYTGNSNRGNIGLGNLYFNDTSYQPEGGKSLNSPTNDVGFHNNPYSDTYQSNSIISRTAIGYRANKVFRFEENKDSMAAVNITDGIIGKRPNNVADFSSKIVAPYFNVLADRGGGNADKVEWDNVKIVITNPA